MFFCNLTACSSAFINPLTNSIIKPIGPNALVKDLPKACIPALATFKPLGICLVIGFTPLAKPSISFLLKDDILTLPSFLNLNLSSKPNLLATS